MKFDLTKLIRPHLLTIKPYASARAEFSGTAEVWLDANENAYGTPGSEESTGFHRYPDPYQIELKNRISEIKNVSTDKIFLGNGSDEAIDLIIKIFCRPGVDNIITLPPTFGMYEVAASVNDVKVYSASLTDNYQIDRAAIESAIDDNTKVIFLCSPNNPTGNLLDRDEITHFLETFSGIVVVDEAYADFTTEPSFIYQLDNYPNLIVLQTFSKAWGIASLRLGAAFASTEIIGFLNKIKLPYNISALTQQTALSILTQTDHFKRNINRIIEQREKLVGSLQLLDIVKKVYPSDANFLLVKFENANDLYKFLTENKVIVRNRSTVRLCEEGLRITIGTEKENKALLDSLKQFQRSN